MAISYVGRAGSNSGQTQVSSFSATTSAAAIAAGDLIVVSVSCSNVGDLTNLKSVTDSAGNSYVSAGFAVDAGQNCLTAVWYAAGCLALAQNSTVTVTLNSSLLAAGEAWFIAVDDITGAATSSPLDQKTIQTISGSTSPWTTGNITTTNANDLLWVAFGDNQGETAAITQANSAPTSGWTIQTGITAGGNGLRTSYQVVSATGTYSGGGTDATVNNGMSAGIFAWKAASGGGGGASGLVITVGGARGQWPNSPTRTTTRVPLTRVEHNVARPNFASPSGGIAQSDLTYDNAAQFYGDGTQTSTIKPPFGAWPNAPLRTTQRAFGFTWQPHNINANAGYAVPGGVAGVAADDLLTVPPGQTYQFFGIPDVVGMQPGVATEQANATLALSGAQVVEPTGAAALEIANAVLSESAAQVVEPTAPVIVTAVVTEGTALVIETTSQTAAEVANAALTEGTVVVIETTSDQAIEQVNAVLSLPDAQVVEPSSAAALEQVNSAVAETPGRVVEPSAPLVVTAVLALTGTALVIETTSQAATEAANAAVALGTVAIIETTSDTATEQVNAALAEAPNVLIAYGLTVQANAALAASAQVIEPSGAAALEVANATVTETPGTVVEPSAPVVVTAILVATGSVIGGGPVQGSGSLIVNAALAETGAFVIATSEPVAANAVLSALGINLVPYATTMLVMTLDGALQVHTLDGAMLLVTLDGATTAHTEDGALTVATLDGAMVLHTD